MTREEVIKALGICTTDGQDCEKCPYFNYGDEQCGTKLKKDAITLLKQETEKEPEPIIKYKVLNREDLLYGFYKYVGGEADWFMNFVDKDDREYANGGEHRIAGAVGLLRIILDEKPIIE